MPGKSWIGVPGIDDDAAFLHPLEDVLVPQDDFFDSLGTMIQTTSARSATSLGEWVACAPAEQALERPSRRGRKP